MNRYIFIINGRSGSGKDEFVSFVKNVSNRYIENISSVDPIKNLFKYLDGDARGEEIRSSMALIKEELEKYGHSPRFLEDRLSYTFPTVAFYHERSWENIEKIKNNFPEKFAEYKIITIFVDRPMEGELFDNEADKNVYENKDKYDVIINNNRDLRYLKNLAHQFCKKYELR